MKHVYLIVLLSLTSCGISIPSNSPHSYNWLIGSWERINDSDGNQTFEIWNKWADNLYIGYGYTLKNRDTIFYEEMRLYPKDTVWELEVLSNGSLTSFRTIKNEFNKLSVYNPDHDFPKEIHYWIQQDTLKARVSNEDMVINFDFVKR